MWPKKQKASLQEAQGMKQMQTKEKPGSFGGDIFGSEYNWLVRVRDKSAARKSCQEP